MNEWDRQWVPLGFRGGTSVKSRCSFMEEMGRELARNSERQEENGEAFRGRVGRDSGQCESKGADREEMIRLIQKTPCLPSAGPCAMISSDVSTALTAKARPPSGA